LAGERTRDLSIFPLFSHHSFAEANQPILLFFFKVVAVAAHTVIPQFPAAAHEKQKKT
jgi:hypothetical protein